MSRARHPTDAATVAQLTSTAPNRGPGPWRVYLVHDGHPSPSQMPGVDLASSGFCPAPGVVCTHTTDTAPLAGFLRVLRWRVMSRAVLRWCPVRRRRAAFGSVGRRLPVVGAPSCPCWSATVWWPLVACRVRRDVTGRQAARAARR